MRKKKMSALLSVFALAALTTAAFAACKPTETHVHKYTSSVTKQATCTEEGVETFTCEAGDDTYTKPIAKLTHKYSEKVTKEATCAKEGEKTFTCDNCGDSYTEAIAKLDHKYSEKVTKEATCAEEGEKTFTCDNCGDSYTEAIAKLDHTIVIDEAVEATEESTGLTEGKHCSVCGEVLVAQTEIPKKEPPHEHSFVNYEVTKKATCTEMGIRTYTCECGETYIRKLAALGHTGYENDGVCDRCDYTAQAKVGETYYLTLDEALAAVTSDTTTIFINSDIRLEKDIETTAQITINKAITLDGNGKKITVTYETRPAKENAAGILVTANATIKNLTVEGPNTAASGWDEGEYGIKVYSTAATLEGVTVTGANAGIQVNSSTVTLKGTITVSSNEFGGIEVCKSSNDGLPAGKLIATDATIVCEGTTVPAIWIDGYSKNEGVVEGCALKACVNPVEGKDQLLYFATLPEMFNASINGIGYAGLDRAIAAAESGATITLLKDSVGDGIKVTSGKNFTVDFNGYTYDVNGTLVGSTGTETNSFQLLKDSTITFKNGTLTSTNSTYASQILIQNYSNLTLENMTVSAGTPFDYIISNNNGNVVIKDTTINAAEGKVAFDVCRYSSYVGPEVTVEGNSVINGKVEISCSGAKDGAIHKLNVTGGTFNGKIYFYNTCPDFVGNITGGTFSSDPSAYVAEGYVAEEISDKYVVHGIVKVGDSYYTTLAEAVAKAESGATVTLLKNTTVTSTVVVTKELTLDLNGNNITGSGWILQAQGTDGDLTITGNGTVKSTDGNVANAINGAKLTIKSGTYEAQEVCVMALDGAAVVIDGGTFTTVDNFVVGTNGTTGRGKNSITINNGTFNGNIASLGYIACGIYVANDDTVVVNGGTFNVVNGVGILARSGKTTVSDKVVFNVTSDGSITEGKVGDAKINIEIPHDIVLDRKAGYPGGDPIVHGFYYNASESVYEINGVVGLCVFEKSVNNGGNTYAGMTVKLMNDVDLKGIKWNPVGQTGATQFQGTFDGQEQTISNMTVNNPSGNANVSSGFFGWLENTNGVVVTNVKFENANVTGSHYVGVVAGYLSGTVTNCVVNNSTVNGVNMNDDANGDKIGGIVGYINAGDVSGNNVTNCTIKGNRDIGGIVGAIATGTTFANNAVSDTPITYETERTYASAGEIVSGRTGFVPDESNTATNVTITLQASVSTAEQLATALTADADKIEVVLANNIDLPIATLGTGVPGSGQYRLGGADTQAIKIDLSGKNLKLTSTYMLALGATNSEATITLKNGTMSSYTSFAQTWNMYDIMFTDCNWVLDGVTFENAVAVNNAGSIVTMKNVTIKEVNDLYAIWVCAGTKLTMDDCTVDSIGRAIKISDQYVAQAARQSTTLTIKNTSFTSVKKAAILVGSTAGANITLENVDISSVSADATNAVWVDNGGQTETHETYTDYANLVTVTGGTKINEPQ